MLTDTLYHRAGRAGRHDGPPVDLPKEAFIDLDTLKRLHRGELRSSRSAPVVQPDHPDPKEVNLQLLAKVMKIMLEYYKQRGVGTFAVFFE